MNGRDPASAARLPRGIIPSLNTPFAENGSVDSEGVRRLVDYVVEAGCGGMLLLAVAGETASLSPAEKERLIDVAAQRNAGRIPLIVGTAAREWPESLALAKRARSAGAAAVLWQPAAGLSEAALADGLTALGEAGPGVVILQDLDWHGGGIAMQIILALFERVPVFRGIKVETIPAGPKYSAIMAATEGRLHVSGGWAVGQMMDALARGVDAFMPTGMEPIYCAIHRRYVASRPEEARTLFEAILPILAFANQHIDVSIRFFKALRLASGVFSTDICRPPVTALDAIQREECLRLVDLAIKIEAGGFSA